MSRLALRRLALLGALPALVVMLTCLGVLARGYWQARVAAPTDADRIAELQSQVEADATIAPKLAEEHARQSAALQTRKAAIETVSLILIGSAVVFFACMKTFIALGARKLVLPEQFVQLNVDQVATTNHESSNQESSGPLVTLNVSVQDAIDLAFVDELIARTGRGREAAIPILQGIQAHYRYLPDAALARVCELTDITPAQIAGTSSFYAQFRRSPVGEHIVRVCHGTACHVAGARQITDELRRHLGIPSGADTDPRRRFTIDEVACLGCCSLAPVMMVDDQTAGKLTSVSAREALNVVDQEAIA